MSLFFRNAASLLSDGDQNGTWLRFMVITTPVAPDGGPAPNGEGGPSAAPANGGGRLIDGIDPNYLHVNPYPNTAAPGQTRECEAGNETYARASRRSATCPATRAPRPTSRARRRRSDGGHGRTSAIVPRRLQRPDQPGARRRDRAADRSWSPPASRSRKSLPWQRPVRVQRGLPDLEQPAARLAGADRRRERRQGRRRSSARRTPTSSRSRWRWTTQGLPIHKDATAEDPLAHLPRGQLLRRPDARHAERRRTSTTATRSPSRRPSTPVQLDQLLTALQTNDREYLQDLLKGLGDGLTRKPTAADDADQDPTCRASPRPSR